MHLLLLLLPLISSGLSGFGGRLFGQLGAPYISTLLSIASAFLALKISFLSFYGNIISIKLLQWINIGDLQIHWGFLFDQVTGIMIVIVTFISSCVHIYSLGYMKGDPHKPRFFSYLALFTFFMLVLVTADNYLQMLVGWEGVGISSYLLINFWFTREQANKSAIKAFLVNRVGDFGLILGLIVMFKLFKSLDYSVVFSLSPYFINETSNIFGIEVNSITLIVILLFIGAMGKSAQLGLHLWLPDAMEGPTPVSALIHAATMVTAGVFLIIRSSPLVEFSDFALKFITIIGALTAFFAGTAAVVQNDIKKVIAYSTCSQLGYMFVACGLSQYSLALYHLFNHAFFKALLFLGAGCIIHSISDQQDMRKMGGLKNILPFTYSIIIIGSLSLMGIPFLTGFYSKDLIIEVASANPSTYGIFSYVLLIAAAFLTSFYSIRLIMMVFIQTPKTTKHIYINAHESDIFMITPVFILAICSIFIGYLTKDIFVNFGTDYWSNSIFHGVHSSNILSIESEFSSSLVKLLPLIFSIIASVLAWAIYSENFHTNFGLYFPNNIKLYNFLSNKWYFDQITHHTITNRILNIGYKITFKLFDKGIFEYTGPKFAFKLSEFLSNLLKMKYHTGFIFDYIGSILLGLILGLLGLLFFIN